MVLLLLGHGYPLGRGKGLGEAVIKAPVAAPAAGGENHKPLAIRENVPAGEHPAVVLQAQQIGDGGEDIHLAAGFVYLNRFLHAGRPEDEGVFVHVKVNGRLVEGLQIGGAAEGAA